VTVYDAKEFVARLFRSMLENVKRLHCAKKMKDILVFARQRIRATNRIAVYIRQMAPILPQSCGIGRIGNARKAVDYL
jgi:hypothetical protein